MIQGRNDPERTQAVYYYVRFALFRPMLMLVRPRIELVLIELVF